MEAKQDLERFGLRKIRSGKVRDLYAWKEELWMVTTDRVSAFDCILPEVIPTKGIIINQIALGWLEKTSLLFPNALLTEELPHEVNLPEWKGRLMRMLPCDPIPMEFIARGYLVGSGWKEYLEKGTVGGYRLPPHLTFGSPLPEPLFSPTTKAKEGHDEALDIESAKKILGDDYELLKNMTLDLYLFGKKYAYQKGLILVDTKFEFGRRDEKLYLIDEMLTPDSSRFWLVEDYEKHKGNSAHYDKQIIRKYLEQLKWNKQPPPPHLSQEIIRETQKRYKEVLSRLFPERLKKLEASISP
ncbi:phosphoribosylaminoimidazole-succinocarboxamide synthase [Methylacidiphilum kamchatkense Kam1]|uniref:Phosphoribosylaminoimidazole-succinocarboxamide synthase n=1 Tax=Methylacidiphilum kamchatkense Kam1 TaxID=1202785 RepID=A0A0C1USX6_9BACT|nr:phosphoribosylaminoimidazolesuccinocarboxamide synthase [Methylacidiphilum kamchatkense]KIE59384.1 phosphoribosylaminoimidazole-succinocarboxamide synthase [Methylacidiphilum kamchatkense Kam1]QDQ42638.1 phosphoribosylaminoimidazole-succinocarboxamide synthase [Methylacidiphilum kamchatkense Kam1]